MLEGKIDSGKMKAIGFEISDERLDLVLNKHPYFQLGLIEKSRRLRIENHIDSLKTTRKCAILFPDRSLLHNFLHQDDPIEQVESGVEQKEDDAIVELLEEENEAVKIAEVTIDKTRQDEEPSETDEALKQDYVAEAINQSIQLEATYYDVNNIVQDKVAESVDDNSKEVLSFSDWISGNAQQKSEGLNKNKLIDKFIQENPQITRLSDQSFYSPIEKGKESISKKSVPYTETLARIFVQQGNKSLAIKAYQYLMLKNPQKSVYFADLIKKLEE